MRSFLLVFIILVSACGVNEPTKIEIDKSCPTTEEKLPAVLELIINLKKDLPEKIEVRYWDELIYSDCEILNEDPLWLQTRKPLFEKGIRRVVAREYFDEVIPPKNFALTITDLGSCVDKDLVEEIYHLKLNNIPYTTTKPFGNQCPQVQQKFSEIF